MKFLASCALLVLTASSVGHAQPASFAALKDDIGQNEWKIPGMACVAITNCAVQIINNGGALSGCSAACVGECKVCFAAGVAGTACQKQPNKDCIFLPGATVFTCGMIRTGECRTGNPSTTWNHDVNGCVCLNNGVITTVACILSDCN